MSVELIYTAVALGGLGALAGFLAGLFGIGGGTVLVPGMYYIFSYFGFSDTAMHMAVGTSLSTIILTGLSSGRAHHKRGAVDFGLLKQVAVGALIGVAIGIVIARLVNVDGLKAVFAVSQITMGTYLLLTPNRSALVKELPNKYWTSFIAALSYVLSTLKGKGGGAQIVLFLTLCNVPMQRAVATASSIGVLTASMGTMGYILIGQNALGETTPYSIGYVVLPAFACIACLSTLTAPLGAALAHKLPVKKLKQLFSIFVICIALKMFVELF